MSERDGRHLFPLQEDGLGLHVDRAKAGTLAHEVLFEDDYVSVKDRPVFLGPALPNNRYVLARFVVMALAIILLGRAFWMQVAAPAPYQLRAEQNRLRHEYVPARRGIIRDRQGEVLAENVPSFDLRVIPWLLPREAESRDELLGKVGREIGLGLQDIQTTISSSTNPAESLVLARDIPYSRALAVEILVGDDPSLHIVIGNKRHYLHSSETPTLSHILGYIGPISSKELENDTTQTYRQTDVIGKTGVEYSYESALRGQAGERVYEVDAQNKVTTLVDERLAVDGSDLKLSIDLKLQIAVEKALREGIEKAKIRRGTAIAMDPRDGSILAIASWPAYDDNNFSGTVSSTYYSQLLNDEDRPLLARAWAGMYPSGSTVKPVVATAALAEDVITPNTTVNSTGGLRLGQTFFPDWRAGGHGITNVRRAIAWSVNTFFYTVGGGYESFVGLGIDRLTDWMRRFGLGSETGLDLPGESSGFVPSKEWKERVKGERWYVGDTYNLSIGQGDLLVTPLQVAAFTADVANGGRKIVPHVGLDPVAESISQASTTQLADPSIIQTVRLGMRDTVVYGSGKALSSLPFTSAGKTGTAQWRSDKPNHAWFTCFAPFEGPEIVVTVMLEEGVEGSVTALPVAQKILSEWNGLKNGISSPATSTPDIKP
ncbi:penicillin-binding protein 2 [Candidatus Uhrbacteria bacterium]|nr:penicillin-binding protein 2 [Candidatus Uhrbacteria bacterium]